MVRLPLSMWMTIGAQCQPGKIRMAPARPRAWASTRSPRLAPASPAWPIRERSLFVPDLYSDNVSTTKTLVTARSEVRHRCARARRRLAESNGGKRMVADHSRDRHVDPQCDHVSYRSGWVRVHRGHLVRRDPDAIGHELQQPADCQQPLQRLLAVGGVPEPRRRGYHDRPERDGRLEHRQAAARQSLEMARKPSTVCGSRTTTS